MTPNDPIKYIEAFRDGKEIEGRFLPHGDWHRICALDTLLYNLQLMDYELRIKPKEPKYYWANEYRTNPDPYVVLHKTPENADKADYKHIRLRRIKLMVVDDD